MTLTPAQTAQRRALRAEARAWRRAAEAYEAVGMVLTPDMPTARRWVRHMQPIMRVRARGYAHASYHFSYPDYDPVLACLLLALECEDEAEEVGRA